MWRPTYFPRSLLCSSSYFHSPPVAQFHSRSTAWLLAADQPKAPGDAQPSAPASPNTTPSPSVASSSPPSPSNLSSRSRSSGGSKTRSGSSNSNLLQYLVGLTVLVIGASWAAVPLYRAFCAHTGYGGTTQTDKDGSKLATMKPSKKEVTVMFNADVSPAMHWKFVPSQASLKVKLGEPVLAFYKATNLRDKPITGVATYNIVPMKAGLYFHKIQCFCFDEQRLRAKETVDMPVFFYIDPAVSERSQMEQDVRTGDVTHLTLSYTFFPVDDSEADEDPAVTAERDQHSGIRIHGPGVIPPQFAEAAAAAAGGVQATPIERNVSAVPK